MREIVWVDISEKRAYDFIFIMKKRFHSQKNWLVAATLIFQLSALEMRAGSDEEIINESCSNDQSDVYEGCLREREDTVGQSFFCSRPTDDLQKVLQATQVAALAVSLYGVIYKREKEFLLGGAAFLLSIIMDVSLYTLRLNQCGGAERELESRRDS